MHIAVTGGYEFDDYALLKAKMGRLTGKLKSVVLHTGPSRGAELLAQRWAQERWLLVKTRYVYHSEPPKLWVPQCRVVVLFEAGDRDDRVSEIVRTARARKIEVRCYEQE